jgi:hypothetical protein
LRNGVTYVDGHVPVVCGDDDWPGGGDLLWVGDDDAGVVPVECPSGEGVDDVVGGAEWHPEGRGADWAEAGSLIIRIGVVVVRRAAGGTDISAKCNYSGLKTRNIYLCIFRSTTTTTNMYTFV